MPRASRNQHYFYASTNIFPWFDQPQKTTRTEIVFFFASMFVTKEKIINWFHFFLLFASFAAFKIQFKVERIQHLYQLFGVQKNKEKTLYFFSFPSHLHPGICQKWFKSNLVSFVKFFFLVSDVFVHVSAITNVKQFVNT